jgi:hypothetical protein
LSRNRDNNPCGSPSRPPERQQSPDQLSRNRFGIRRIGKYNQKVQCHENAIFEQKTARHRLDAGAVRSGPADIIGTTRERASQYRRPLRRGNTLASLAFRQIFNCFSGTTIGNDGVTFSTGDLPTSGPAPGFLPNACIGGAEPVNGFPNVQGMYAGVGSGNGLRGFIANSPSQ